MTGKKLGLVLAPSCSEFLPCISVEGCISTLIYKTDPKTNAHKLFLLFHCYLGGKAPVFNHMTQRDKPYNKKQTMQGQPWASKPWSPFVQHFPRRLLEIPVNKAECRESTVLKQRAQHSGLLNHLSYSPGENEFATESHKWTEFAYLKAASLHFAASPAWCHCSMSTSIWWEESRDWEMGGKKGCFSKAVFETVAGSCLRYFQISPQWYFFIVLGRLKGFFSTECCKNTENSSRISLKINKTKTNPELILSKNSLLE